MSQLRKGALSLTILLGSFVLFALLFLRLPVLFDGDSYFHLAAAGLYADGVPDGLPWARFSVMHQGWGDKELLFHLFLLPFTRLTLPLIGGRLALATLNAVLLTLLSALGWRAIGRWGLLLGPIVYLLQPAFLNRSLRLRPELLAVTILIVLIYGAGRRRYVVAGVAAFAFSLSYTAVQVPLGLTLFWVAWDRIRRGTWNWKLGLSVPLGIGAGLVLHPQFPKNLEIWWIQNVRFFELRGSLDVGEEIFAPSLGVLVASNAGLLIALIGIWLSTRGSKEREVDDATGPYFAISAAVFVVLYVLMGRMVTWAAPLVALAVVFELSRRGLSPTMWMRLGARRVPLLAVLAIAALVAGSQIVTSPLVDMLRNAERIDNEAELERFGASVPAGANVAATWRSGEVYAFFAPAGRYLNVLDPIFMALPYPDAYAAQEAVFNGTEPDVPLALVATLDSDHIAFDRFETPVLFERVSRDPRFRIDYVSRNVLATVRPDDSFVLDWVTSEGKIWPRTAATEVRGVEGYVDLTRLGVTEGCVTLTHELDLDAREKQVWNFSPWGTGRIEVEGQLAAVVDTPSQGILGSGARIRADLDEGHHLIAVETCAAGGRAGFYLRMEKRMRHVDP